MELLETPTFWHMTILKAGTILTLIYNWHSWIDTCMCCSKEEISSQWSKIPWKWTNWQTVALTSKSFCQQPNEQKVIFGWGRSFPGSNFILILPANFNFILILIWNYFILNPDKSILSKCEDNTNFIPKFSGHLEFYPLIHQIFILSLILLKILNFIQ